MKKLLAFLLSLFLLFSLIACGPDNPDDDGKDDGGTTPDDGEEPVIIGPDEDPATPDIDWDGVV